MFRTVLLYIVRSFSLYTQQWYISYRFADSLRAGSGRNPSVPILLASCQQTCMTNTIDVFTVKTSWWWTDELSETCRVLFEKQIWETSESSWLYYKNLPRCTVTWTSNQAVKHYMILNQIQSLNGVAFIRDKYLWGRCNNGKRISLPFFQESRIWRLRKFMGTVKPYSINFWKTLKHAHRNLQ